MRRSVAGSASHLTAERFKMAAKIEAQHVPFKGAPEALREIIADRIDFYFTPLAPAKGMIEQGELIALAVSSSQRATSLPNVPTTVEAGYPNSEYNFWVGVLAPAQTPAPQLLERLSEGDQRGAGQSGREGKARPHRRRSDAADVGAIPAR